MLDVADGTAAARIVDVAIVNGAAAAAAVHELGFDLAEQAPIRRRARSARRQAFVLPTSMPS